MAYYMSVQDLSVLSFCPHSVLNMSQMSGVSPLKGETPEKKSPPKSDCAGFFPLTWRLLLPAAGADCCALPDAVAGASL